MKKLIAPWALAALIAPAVASQPVEEQPKISAEARDFLEQGASITHTWRVNEHLTGIALQTAPGQGMVVFADATGRYLVSGAALDTETGTNIAETAMREHFPEPGPEEMMAEAADGTHWVATGVGDGNEPIYIVTDTQCGYCHEVARALIERGVAREVRWVLVGFLGPKSVNQAAALLEMPPEQAEAALLAILTGQADGMPDLAPEGGAAALSENEAWARRWKINGTPILLVPHDGGVHRINGLPGASFWDIIAP